MPQTAYINLYSKVGRDYSHLFSQKQGEFRLEYYERDQLVWTGFSVPEMYRENYHQKEFPVSLVFTDGLMFLKDRPFDMDVTENVQRLDFIVKYLLDQISETEAVYENIDLLARGNHILSSSQADIRNFSGMDCYKVLTYLAVALHVEVRRYSDPERGVAPGWLLLDRRVLADSRQIRISDLRTGGQSTFAFSDNHLIADPWQAQTKNRLIYGPTNGAIKESLSARNNVVYKKSLALIPEFIPNGTFGEAAWISTQQNEENNFRTYSLVAWKEEGIIEYSRFPDDVIQGTYRVRIEYKDDPFEGVYKFFLTRGILDYLQAFPNAASPGGGFDSYARSRFTDYIYDISESLFTDTYDNYIESPALELPGGVDNVVKIRLLMSALNIGNDINNGPTGLITQGIVNDYRPSDLLYPATFAVTLFFESEQGELYIGANNLLQTDPHFFLSEINNNVALGQKVYQDFSIPDLITANKGKLTVRVFPVIQGNYAVQDTPQLPPFEPIIHALVAPYFLDTSLHEIDVQYQTTNDLTVTEQQVSATVEGRDKQQDNEEIETIFTTGGSSFNVSSLLDIKGQSLSEVTTRAGDSGSLTEILAGKYLDEASIDTPYRMIDVAVQDEFATFNAAAFVAFAEAPSELYRVTRFTYVPHDENGLRTIRLECQRWAPQRTTIRIDTENKESRSSPGTRSGRLNG